MSADTNVHHGLLHEVDPPLLAAPDREIRVLGRVPAGATDAEAEHHLELAATEVRRRAVQTVGAAKAGHLGGEFSITDTLVTLYLDVMNISPEQVDAGDPERDRLILSKGHAANALYTALAVGGYLHPEALRTFLQSESMLNGHPARNKIAAVEANTGPLGHGLPIAVGTAIAAVLDGSKRRTFVLLGDGELQVGSNWEAFMTAGHRRLSNLTAVIDRNRLQQGARVADTNDLEPLADKLVAFGCFLSARAMEQIKADVAYSEHNVKLVAQSPGVAYGDLGPTHHSIEDFAWMRTIPGLTVVAPVDPVETAQVIAWAAGHEGPAYIRVSRMAVPAVYPEGYQFVPGKAVTLREGTAATIIATGTTVARALAAADLLAADGVEVRVLAMPTIKPLDEAAVVAAAAETGGVVTVEEALVTGLGGAVAEVLAEQHPAPLRRIGFRDEFAITGTAEWLLDRVGASPEGIAATVRELA